MLYTKEKIEQLQHRWNTAKGKRLIKIIKESRCYLSPVLFRDKVHNFAGINDEEVRDGIDLRGINLCGFDFRVSVQEEDEGYHEEMAVLSNIHLEGAILKHSNFQDGKIHDCFFENADLSHAEFKNATLNSCNFQEAELLGANLQGTKLINCSFIDASIKDMTTSTTILDQKTTFGKELKSEKEGSHHFASIEYKQIKQMYKNSSLHEIADEYHYKEMVTKRKILDKKNPVRWINYIFGDLLCKYGTSFVRVLMASLLVMVICAGLYTAHDGLHFIDKPLLETSFASSLYFSVVTFTTLGYGDFYPVGPMRFVAAGESFLGAALLALFTVIVARVLIRD